MSPLDERLVRLAVSLSPAGHREVRREQWEADVRDARELDLSALGLACGALTTAILHRTRPRRSTWETPVTITARAAAQPHTLKTIPLLIALAFASVLAGVALLGLLGRYGGSPSVASAKWVAVTLLTVVPGILTVSAFVLVEGASARRRLVASAAVVGLLALSAGAQTGALPSWLFTGIGSAGLLAAWLFVRDRPGRSWWLLVLPLAVHVVAQFFIGPAVLRSALPVTVTGFLSVCVVLLPYLAAVVGAIVAGRERHEPVAA